MIFNWLIKIIQMTLLALIWLYQHLVSPLLPPACRFYPSCSEYARQCVIKYGPFVGAWRSLRRVSRCHPFHPGGVDLP